MTNRCCRWEFHIKTIQSSFSDIHTGQNVTELTHHFFIFFQQEALRIYYTLNNILSSSCNRLFINRKQKSYEAAVEIQKPENWDLLKAWNNQYILIGSEDI